MSELGNNTCKFTVLSLIRMNTSFLNVNDVSCFEDKQLFIAQ